MPVLFGKTYYLPIIAVVVLLLLLLLVVLLRKRRSAKNAIIETNQIPTEAPGPAAPAPAPMPAPALRPAAPAYAPAPAAPSYATQQVAQPLPARPVQAQAQAQAEETIVQDPGKKRRKEPKRKKSRGEVESNPVEQPQNLEPAPPQSSPRRPSAAPAPDPLILSSPLSAILIDIIQGWGDIEDADLNRLKLFRPEKVKAAIQDFQLPKEMKSDQQVFNRFSTLQRWAAELPVSPPAAPQSTAPQPAATQRAAPQAAPRPAAPQPVAPAPTPPQPTRPPVQQNSYGETFASIQAAKVSVPEHPSKPEQSWTYVPPAHDAPAAPAAAPTFAAPTPPAAPIPAAPTAPAAPPSVAAPTTPSSQGWTAVEEQIRNEPAPSEFALLQPKTADELMQLPQEDQRKKVVHLEPAELSKVFDQTTDPELKKAVINRLEDAGNPASLEVLRRCLDDPDPEIQYYALQAADRLLGV